MRIVKPENEAKKENTGKQIQSLATLMCALSWLSIFLGSMAYFATEKYISGIILFIVGFFVAWACTRVLQGFGELIEDTAANRANTARIIVALQSIQKTLQTNTQQNKKEPEA